MDVVELKEHDDEVPDLQLSTQLPSDPEKKLVAVLGKMMRIVGDRLQDDAPFQDAIDGLIESPGPMSEKFWQLVTKVFEHGKITWERIAVLFYVAGRMAVKVLEARLPSLVVEIFRLTVNYFHTKLLSWVRSNGGWVCSPTQPESNQSDSGQVRL
ncbi:Apoptosis regulator BAX [Merluccius polli]|uniref:Apoptosis regulator BAX n=1 Tax=Merluccius polli TaxID=89951 RepID=A0AA47NW98_MERPO|nr:Apoptosis regulator BAX [Merluccius polli]